MQAGDVIRRMQRFDEDYDPWRFVISIDEDSRGFFRGRFQRTVVEVAGGLGLVILAGILSVIAENSLQSVSSSMIVVTASELTISVVFAMLFLSAARFRSIQEKEQAELREMLIRSEPELFEELTRRISQITQPPTAT